MSGLNLPVSQSRIGLHVWSIPGMRTLPSRPQSCVAYGLYRLYLVVFLFWLKPLIPHQTISRYGSNLPLLISVSLLLTKKTTEKHSLADTQLYQFDQPISAAVNVPVKK